jgi:hypothetical protein
VAVAGGLPVSTVSQLQLQDMMGMWIVVASLTGLAIMFILLPRINR